MLDQVLSKLEIANVSHMQPNCLAIHQNSFGSEYYECCFMKVCCISSLHTPTFTVVHAGWNLLKFYNVQEYAVPTYNSSEAVPKPESHYCCAYPPPQLYAVEQPLSLAMGVCGFWQDTVLLSNHVWPVFVQQRQHHLGVPLCGLGCVVGGCTSFKPYLAVCTTFVLCNEQGNFHTQTRILRRPKFTHSAQQCTSLNLPRIAVRSRTVPRREMFKCHPSVLPRLLLCVK